MRIMNSTQVLMKLHRDRESLAAELSKTRRASLEATRNGDFRKVAQLTLVAARLNESLSASQAQEDSL
jgi:hypothetical protein